MNKIIKTCVLLVGFCLAISAQAQCQNIIDEVLVDKTCTKIRTFKSDNLSKNPILIIALHGDSPFNNPSYQYKFAKIVAEDSNNLISIGMLRPGYTDEMKRTSDGVKGDAIGDNYDKIRVEQIAKAIQKLKTHYKPKKVILAGHSGGSAITANLISLYPKLVDHAIIVSCPCDVNSWREDMYKLTKKPIFNGALETLSPIKLVKNISKTTKISMFSGKNDVVTKTSLSNEYKLALERLDIDVKLYVIDGEHNIFLNNNVISSTIKIISGYNKTFQKNTNY